MQGTAGDGLTVTGIAAPNVRGRTRSVKTRKVYTWAKLPILVTLWAVAVNLVGQWVQPGVVDWRYFWAAGHALVTGANPYAAAQAAGPFPLFYPGPAVLILAPFGLLPLRLGWLLWAAAGGLAYGWAARVYGRGLWVGLLSASFAEAILFGQWSPLLVGAAVIPALGCVLAAKPTIGSALFALRPHRYALIGALSLTVLSFVVLPSWPLDWLRALRQTNHVPPVLRPGGFLLLLAFLKWRTPEGRMLGLLALVPQTTGLYETLPLFLLARNRWEGYGLAVLSYVVAFGQGGWDYRLSIGAEMASRWPVIFLGLWLPALRLVLTRSGASRPAASPCR